MLDPLDGRGWSYRVDLDEDGTFDHEGILDRRISFRYGFTITGLHQIVVELTGDEDTEIRLPVIVEGSGALQAVAVGQLPNDEGDPSDVAFEGLAVAPDGSVVYAADYRSGDVFAVDPADPNMVLARGASGYSIEGLSIAPSGSYLFAAYKYTHVARFALPDLVPDPFLERPGLVTGMTADFFVTALDDRRALYSGSGNLFVLDVPSLAVEAKASDDDGTLWYTWHHAVSEDGATVAAIDQEAWDHLRVLAMPSLETLRTIPLPAGFTARQLAFGPDPSILYAFGWSQPVSSGTGEPIRARLLVIDLGSAESIQDMRLDVPVSCHGYCVANPASRSTDGRWVVFEAGGGTALFVDTTTHLPAYTLESAGWGASVAASPIDPASFWFLTSQGILRKIRVGS